MLLLIKIQLIQNSMTSITEWNWLHIDDIIGRTNEPKVKKLSKRQSNGKWITGTSKESIKEVSVRSKESIREHQITNRIFEKQERQNKETQSNNQTINKYQQTVKFSDEIFLSQKYFR